MSDNKDDYIQKNLEQALEVCGDSEFLQKQRSEYFSTENEKISVIDQSFSNTKKCDYKFSSN